MRMNTNNVISAIESLKSEYLKATASIDAVGKNSELSQTGKDKAIARETEKYFPKLEKLRTNAIQSVDNLKDDIREQRRADIAKGLEVADEIALVTETIREGSLDDTMLEDVLEIYKDNTLALRAIKGTLEKSTIESYQLYATKIPNDRTDALSKSFDKLRKNLESIQLITTSQMSSGDAIIQGASGLAFDSMIDFLRNIDETE